MPDFFVCDLFDAAPKGDMASMEHPIFSLSTKPDRRARRYEHNGHFLQVSPSDLGLATVHDRDVLIFCISQVMAALNEGRAVSKVLRFKAYDLLISTNRGIDGRGYEQLRAAFKRLQGTQIETNIITGGIEMIDIFSLVDRVRIVRETREGRMLDVEVTLSDWVFNAIHSNEVLTLHRDYFRLRKPLERRIYELARKHCGRQGEWRISLDLLQKKCGSNSTLREFRRLVGEIVEQDQAHGHMPDYALSFTDDVLTVWPRRALPDGSGEAIAYDRVRLTQDGYEAARKAAPGWDVYGLEGQWKAWMQKTQKPLPRAPDAAFAKWCARYFQNHGRP
ncbi:plasmid replication initiator TrfA [Siccirubricoccus phaeus]|uniref:plasmid replication initiator TrfA n=1 Tax=Siccirubricoccus phaeus TaxID=2595053 RepID=UPI001F1F936F|nr:replication initiator protein A [Siccirubricoccus phaeus]